MRTVKLPWIHSQHALQFRDTDRKRLHFTTRATTGSPSNNTACRFGAYTITPDNFPADKKKTAPVFLTH
jgi:hypothetical protein